MSKNTKKQNDNNNSIYEPDFTNQESFIKYVKNLWKYKGEVKKDILESALQVELDKLPEKINIHRRDKDSPSLLYLMCTLEIINIAKTLLGKGACAGDNHAGDLCLGIACVKGNLELVRSLVEAGADINKGSTGAKKASNLTILINESRSKPENIEKYKEIIKYLCDKGAKFWWADYEKKSSGVSPLQAMQKVSLLNDVFEELTAKRKTEIKEKNPSEAEGISLYEPDFSNEKSFKKYVTLLKQRFEKGGLNPNLQDEIRKALNGLEVVKVVEVDKPSDSRSLLKVVNVVKVAKADKSSDSRSQLLNFICKKNIFDIAKTLLEKGADPNHSGTGHSCLGYACINGNLELVKLLVDDKANVNTGGFGRFKTSNLSLLINLIKNSKNKKAIEKNIEKYKEIIKYLYEKGADPNSVEYEYSNNQISPLEAASDVTELKVIFAPFKKKNTNGLPSNPGKTSDFSTVDPNNFSHKRKAVLDKAPNKKQCITHSEDPKDDLHTLCKKGALLDMVFLMGRGANVNTKDDNGDTILHILCKYFTDSKSSISKKEILSSVKILMKCEADIFVKNNTGETPLSIVKAHQDIISKAHQDIISKAHQDIISKAHQDIISKAHQDIISNELQDIISKDIQAIEFSNLLIDEGFPKDQPAPLNNVNFDINVDEDVNNDLAGLSSEDDL